MFKNEKVVVVQNEQVRFNTKFDLIQLYFRNKNKLNKNSI